ncbi:MAG: lipoprotein-releasing ABC transporter permease subunit [Candidatus Omnitrophica bacterium]|nr:lipoprotein-releasing ABC transporter permease subunit [Candidatus Omnitrophota bacterium]MBU2437245.1 lipoprotein-releasing ABC transporter permease subunit [Candidatus Omnitrophota bacterium]MBU2551077.1 lipoprotein-releasing ABC transporter permease subunit [Pseudomonadota bacterium]
MSRGGLSGFEAFIGWRYLKAKRKQTFISAITLFSLAGVALGVTALIIVLAVMTGYQEDLRAMILGINSHVIVMQYGRPLEDYPRIEPRLRELKGVDSIEPFIYGQVMVSARGGTSGIVIRGLDTDEARRNGRLARMVDPGALSALDSREGAPRIILGAELARQLEVGPGDPVRLIGQGDASGLRNGEFVVAGLFRSGMHEYDATLAYLGLEAAQRFLGLGRGVTGLEIRLEDLYQADRVRKEAAERLGPSFWVRDWMQMNRNLFAALRLQKTVLFIILTLTILVAAFNIVSTLIMVVMEKTRDIAILKSMGATSGSVMKIFVFQGLVVGLLGTAAGLAGGLVLCGLLARYHFIKLPGEVYYMSSLPVSVRPLDVSLVTLSAVALCFLATLYPAWQASRLNPVEALRYE